MAQQLTQEHLQLFANRSRAEIIKILLEGETSVGELGRRLDLGQSALSQHLAKMRAAGVVDTRRDRQTIFYSSNFEPARQLLALLRPVDDAQSDDDHVCPICLKPFAPADLCATDVTEGICHYACLEGSPTVDVETGEPVDGPISTYTYASISGTAAPVASIPTGVKVTGLNWQGDTAHCVCGTYSVGRYKDGTWFAVRRFINDDQQMEDDAFQVSEFRATVIRDCEEDYRERILALISPSPVGETFQQRVQPWMMACFGAEISADKLERADRFIEEALELVQSGGYPRERIAALTDYVYGRDAGEPAQEVGGVMVTLAAYCLAHDLDMHDAAETELARIWTKVEKIRAKQAAKPTGSALPVASPVGGQDLPVAGDVKGVFDAVIACPHEIDAQSVVLKADSRKPGNALKQLHDRITEALSHPAPGRAVEALREAAAAVIAARSDTYRAGNNRQVGIQDENGEKCWIVPFDEMFALEDALSANEGRKNG